MKRILPIILIFVLTTLIAVAEVGVDDQGNPNDPTVNDRANACFEGGTMENRCDSVLEWIAGWYLIRFEFDLLSREQIPAWVAWVLPPEVVPEELASAAPVPVVLPLGCQLIGPTDYAFFATNTIPANTNGTNWWTDSTCSVRNWGGWSISLVIASSQTEADALCLANNGATPNASFRINNVYGCS